MADRQTYRDKAKCPQGHKWIAIRRKKSAGKKVTTYCFTCDKHYRLLASRLDIARSTDSSDGDTGEGQQ